MPLRICILETDHLRPELADTFVGYGHMFKQLFTDQPIEAEFETFNVVDGQYPPEDRHYDAYLVTGSKADSFGTDPGSRPSRTTCSSVMKRATSCWASASAISCWRCCWAARPNVRSRAGGSGCTSTAWRIASPGCSRRWKTCPC